MTNGDIDAATKIQGYLDRARDEYAVTRAALVEALRNHPPSVLDRLVAGSEEFGVDHILARLRDTPGDFLVADATSLPMAQLAVLLPQLMDLNWEIGGLTGERENLAGRMTIADGRIFNVDGREATVDLASGKLRYLDQTSEPLDLQVVELTGDDPRPAKRRRRDRDR